MIIQINRFDIPVISDILGQADIKRMDGILVQAVRGRDSWTYPKRAFSTKDMKKGDKFYFVPFSNIYGAAEDVGYDIFEKLYNVSDAINGIIVSLNAARVILDNEWRLVEHWKRGCIPLAGGGGYMLKINEVNFPALTRFGDRKRNVMQGLIVQGWGVEREGLKYYFSRGYSKERKMTLSSMIMESDAAFYVPMENIWDALEEKDSAVIPEIRKAFGVVKGLNFALSDVAELYLA